MGVRGGVLGQQLRSGGEQSFLPRNLISAVTPLPGLCPSREGPAQVGEGKGRNQRTEGNLMTRPQEHWV